MKPKSLLRALFLLMACAALALMTTSCPNPIHPLSSTSSTAAASTGSITGMVAVQGQTNYGGVTVTAELTDGIKSVSVQKAIATRQAVKAIAAAQATTNASGAYTLSGLAPGTYTLNAVSADGLAAAVTTSVTVSAGTTTQALLMILTQTGQIQGTATLKGSSDSTGIVVFVAGTSYSAMTDINGNFLMSYVPAGTNYTLVASKVGYGSVITTVNVSVNSITKADIYNVPLAFVLSPSPYVAPTTTGSISGTATLSNVPSGPYAGIFVYLVGTSYVCVTNAAGAFTLTGVAPGSYTYMASSPGYTAVTGSVSVTAGATANIPAFALNFVGPYFVFYNANAPNGGTVTGSVPADPTNYLTGFTVTVLGNTGGLVIAGYAFTGWNTQANGLGTSYTPGQTFTMGSANVTLYAVWAGTTQSVLTVQAGAGGTISVPASSPIGVTAGVATNITAVANPNYYFVNWTVTAGSGVTFGSTGTATGTSATDTVTLTGGNVTIQANFATHVYVGGRSFVYVGGIYLLVPGYWKDGTWVGLTNPYVSMLGTIFDLGDVTSLVVSGSTVYVGGTCYQFLSSPNAFDVSYGGYWGPYGSWVTLPDPYGSYGSRGISTCVTSLVISGSNLYAGGWSENSSGACTAGYWLNGNWVGLSSSGSGQSVTSLVVSGSNVYAGGANGTGAGGSSGYTTGAAGYWLNGNWVGLSSSGMVTSLVVSGSNVYAGGVNDTAAGYWLNGNWVGLSSSPGIVYSLVIANQ